MGAPPSKRSRTASLTLMLLTVGACAAATPSSARPPSPCEVGKHYVKLIQEHRYSEVGDLFTEDAVWYTPIGEVVRGRTAIKAFYAKFLNHRTPNVRADNFVEQGRFCAFELELKLDVDEQGKVIIGGPDGVGRITPQPKAGEEPSTGAWKRRAMDHFTVNEQGLVTRMIVYNAPTTYWAE